jgi:hypothetical protein
MGSRYHGSAGGEQECAGGLKPQLVRRVLWSTRSMTYAVRTNVTSPTITAIPSTRTMRPIRRTQSVWHSGLGPAAADPAIRGSRCVAYDSDFYQPPGVCSNRGIESDAGVIFATGFVARPLRTASPRTLRAYCVWTFISLPGTKLRFSLGSTQVAM